MAGSLFMARRNELGQSYKSCRGHMYVPGGHPMDGACTSCRITPVLLFTIFDQVIRPRVELREDPQSFSHRCHFFEVAFVWELTLNHHFSPWLSPGWCLSSSLSLSSPELSDAPIHEPSIRVLLETASHFCEDQVTPSA